MQSNDNQKNKQEEISNTEEVTISLKEYYNMKKCFKEPGSMNSSTQRRKGKESMEVVPETPQTYKNKSKKNENQINKQVHAKL